MSSNIVNFHSKKAKQELSMDEVKSLFVDGVDVVESVTDRLVFDDDIAEEDVWYYYLDYKLCKVRRQRDGQIRFSYILIEKNKITAIGRKTESKSGIKIQEVYLEDMNKWVYIDAKKRIRKVFIDRDSGDVSILDDAELKNVSKVNGKLPAEVVSINQAAVTSLFSKK